MQLAMCWSGGSHLHLWSKNRFSSHIVTTFMDVLLGVIHTITLLENLLSVIVTHLNDLLNVARYASPSLTFAMNATDIMYVVVVVVALGTD